MVKAGSKAMDEADKKDMLRVFRQGTRLLLIVLSTALSALLLVLGLPLFLPGWSTWVKWRDLVFRFWAKMFLLILRVRIEMQGHPPKPPFVLVANHLSYLDVMVLGSCLNAVFVGKAEIARWPVVGPLSRLMNTIFIDRQARRDIPRALARMEKTLARGQGIVLFPEGTSTRGTTVTPFHPSLLETAARTGRPVHYASLSYRTSAGDPAAESAVCWWGGEPFFSHLLGLLAVRSTRAYLRFGQETVQDDDRKRLACRLRLAVLDHFKPISARTEAGGASPAECLKSPSGGGSIHNSGPS